MRKEVVDEIVTEYLQKIYGFALSKTGKIDMAEELASQIVLDVYVSLLKYNNIENINGYIYKISANVYARFIDKNKRGIHLSLDEVTNYNPFDYHDFVDDIIQSESYQLVKREIEYLSKIQRQIIVKHYYENKKIKEIAKELNLPEGTVKWHMHDAKNNMKEGMNKMRKSGTLSFNPIKLYGLGHSGSPGKLGDTSYFLRSSLNQNIAYAAYQNPKTINEIAQELSVSPVFIEEEVEYLVEYGFMDKVGNDKYLTNIIIHEKTKESDIKLHELKLKYAKILKEKYIPLLDSAIDKIYEDKNVYIPDNDKNLLKWSVITYALSNKLFVGSNIDVSKYYVKRPDGGEYAAFATVDNEYVSSIDYSKYQYCGSMGRESCKYPVNAWQINTYYDNRDGGWRENITEDYEYLYEVYSNKIQKDEINAEKFKRLYDKGYLIGDKINVIIMNYANNLLNDLLPNITDELIEVNKQYSEEKFAVEKDIYPPHMLDWVKSACASPLSGIFMFVVEKLVEDGTLQLPTDEQKHGLITLMFVNE